MKTYIEVRLYVEQQTRKGEVNDTKRNGVINND